MKEQEAVREPNQCPYMGIHQGGCSGRGVQRMGVVLYNKLVYYIIQITTPCFHCTPLWWILNTLGVPWQGFWKQGCDLKDASQGREDHSCHILPFQPTLRNIYISLLSLQTQPNAAPNLFQRGVEHGEYEDPGLVMPKHRFCMSARHISTIPKTPVCKPLLGNTVNFHTKNCRTKNLWINNSDITALRN